MSLEALNALILFVRYSVIHCFPKTPLLNELDPQLNKLLLIIHFPCLKQISLAIYVSDQCRGGMYIKRE